MVFKCLECGHLFEPGEESRWQEGHGEIGTGCPKCLSAFEETVRCAACGSHHLDDELYNGMCKDCLTRSMTAQNMADYLRDIGGEKDFYIDVFFSRQELLDLLHGGFLQKIALEKLQKKRDALVRCQKYINDDECGLADYAEWYVSQRRGCV